MLIDTHAHLNFPDFDNDLDQVIEKSVENGVTKIICVSSNIEDSQKAIKIAKKYPGIVFAAVGIHPQKTDPGNRKTVQAQVQELEKLAQEKEVVGIGECGLDYSPAPPGELDRTREEQFFLFQKQIELAQKLSLPICIHSRKAFNDVLSIINQQLTIGYLSGVFHCYSAGKSNIKKVLDFGFYFGLDGNITYDEGLQNVVKEIPLEKIVLETDSPLLAPKPYRGLRNTPGNVKIIAEFLAQLKGLSFAKICQKTSQNAQKIFSKVQ